MFYRCSHSKSFDLTIFTLKFAVFQENKEARNKIHIISDYINLEIETVFDF